MLSSKFWSTEKKTTQLSRKVVLFCRAIASILSIGGLVLYVILLNYYNKREDTANESVGRSLYRYLPLGALSFSVTWNCFSLVTLGLGAAKWLSNRFRNSVDVFCAIELAALGYISFIYSLVTEWHDNKIGGGEKVLQVVALTLLSLTGAAHLLFFCFDCAAAHFPSPPLRGDEPESWLGYLPSYPGDLGNGKSSTYVSEYSDVISLQRTYTPPQRSSSTRSTESAHRPNTLKRKSGSLHKKSNSFIRPVRPTPSISVPDYTPNGFVTVLDSTREDEIEPVSPVSPVSPKAMPFRSPTNRQSGSSYNSISPPVSPVSSNRRSERFPISVPPRSHSRSVSSVVREPDLSNRASHIRSASSPNTPVPFAAIEPLKIVPTNPFLQPRSAPPPPIEEHPAFKHDNQITRIESHPKRSEHMGSPSTAWGRDPYSDSQTFIPAYQEMGSAFRY